MVTALNKRFLLFLFGCVVVRSLFAYVAKKINPKHLPLMGSMALIPVIGWIYIYITGSRRSGPEVFGGRIWWNELRIPHAFLYILFAIYAMQRKTFSWIPLLIDVIFGLVSFLVYHCVF